MKLKINWNLPTSFGLITSSRFLIKDSCILSANSLKKINFKIFSYFFPLNSYIYLSFGWFHLQTNFVPKLQVLVHWCLLWFLQIETTNLNLIRIHNIVYGEKKLSIGAILDLVLVTDRVPEIGFSGFWNQLKNWFNKASWNKKFLHVFNKF